MKSGQENEWQKKADLPDSIGVGKRTRTTGSDSGNGSKSTQSAKRRCGHFSSLGDRPGRGLLGTPAPARFVISGLPTRTKPIPEE